MIRYINYDDINNVNELLKDFNYSISKSSLEDSFFKGLVYDDKIIKGVLLFRTIYERIELEYIIVDKSYRKSKIATYLMDYLVKYTKKNNIENITLEVNVNNTKAINLYKKFDFEIVTIRKNYYKGEDAYLMIRVI